jgi:hypothetical protein
MSANNSQAQMAPAPARAGLTALLKRGKTAGGPALVNLAEPEARPLSGPTNGAPAPTGPRVVTLW